MKFLTQYILTTLMFCGLFISTQVIDTEIWYLGNYEESGAVYHNHKTRIQLRIFANFLPIWLTVLTFFKMNNSISKRRIIFLSNLTIVVIYGTNFLLSKIVESGGFNIYYDWRVNMGPELTVFTIIATTFLIWLSHWIVGILKRKYRQHAV